jgi:hypothetical protein
MWNITPQKFDVGHAIALKTLNLFRFYPLLESRVG